MSKTIIDIYYYSNPFGVYVEDTFYVEDGKQFIKSTLVELDEKELKDKYYHILNMTSSLARFNERPVKIYNEFASSIVEHTKEDDFDMYGDYRTLEDYTDTVYNKHHQSIIQEQIAFDERLNELFDDTDVFSCDHYDGTRVG